MGAKVPIQVIRDRVGVLGKFEYEIIGEYSNTNTSVLFKHLVCGYEWMLRATNFINSGSRCPKCNVHKQALNRLMSHSEYVKRVNATAGEEYSVLEDYQKSSVKILHRHNLCGHEWRIKPNAFLSNGSRCPKCSTEKIQKDRALSHEQYEEELNKRHQGEYEVLEKYVNAHYKLHHVHKKCGFTWKISPANLKKNRCPNCTNYLNSKGIKKITEFLCQNKISFDREVRFESCRNERSLPFDFAIYQKDKLYCLIEFDGKQHYEPFELFGGLESLHKLKINDEIKSLYCKENGIKLIRIPYWEEKNIQIILRNELMELLHMAIN